MAMDVIDYRIEGHDMQYVEVDLDPGEAMVGEAGSLMFMEDGVSLETIFGDGSSSSGRTSGLFGKLVGAGKRLLTGESLFTTVYQNQSNQIRKLGFAAPYPGKILAMDLSKLGGQLICQKDAFLVAAKGTKVDIAFQKKVLAGLFGGEASDVDLRAIKNPGIEIGRSFALFDVLDEVGERHVVGFIAVFPLAADLEEVGSSGGGRGLVFVSVGALDLGIDFAEDALGGGLVVGQQEGKLNLNGLHRGLEDGFVYFISGLMAEGVLDGELLVEDAARDAQLTRGGGDLDAVEVENAWRCFLEQLFSLFELGFRVHFGRGGFLSKQTREEGEEGEG
jgi:hypothetical protein